MPWVLRYRLSIDRLLLSRILDGFLRTIFSWQRHRGRKLGIAGGQTGAVTFVQRFGSALNLHPHLHSLVPDGLFVPTSGEELGFVPLPPPTREDIESLLRKIAQRLTRLVQNVADDEASFGGRMDETAAALEEALARSLRAPAPADQLSFADQDHEGRASGPDALRAKLAGFSLHAGRWVPAEDREALERLCRYGLRAPFSQERLSRRADGRIVYELRRPWPHARGVTQLVLEPLELLRRLAALVPAPGRQMVRYHGCFANRSKLRPLLPAPPPRLLPQGVEPPAPENTRSADGACNDRTRGRVRLSWAQLLYRVLFLDALLCTKCGGRMKVMAFLSDPAVITRILQHLKIPASAPPISPARARNVDPFWTDDEPWLDESEREHGPTGRGRERSPRAPP